MRYNLIKITNYLYSKFNFFWDIIFKVANMLYSGWFSFILIILALSSIGFYLFMLWSGVN